MMVRSWCRDILTKMIDNISDVEPCVGQVDEFPNESKLWD